MKLKRGYAPGDETSAAGADGCYECIPKLCGEEYYQPCSLGRRNISPVELAFLIRRFSRHLHHCASTNVSTALALNSSYHRSSSPAVRIVEGLALRAGTFCRSVRGLSPEDIVDRTHVVRRSVCGLRSKSSHNLYKRNWE